MRRHQRSKNMSEAKRRVFANNAGRFHHEIITQMCDLRISSTEYQALLALSGHIIESIETITGEPPNWVRGHST